jgi:hypothetical protein
MEEEEGSDAEKYTGKDFQFHRVRLNPKGVATEYDSDQESEEDEVESVQEDDVELNTQDKLEDSGPRRSKRTKMVLERVAG